MRELSGAVPAGFKLSPGSQRQYLAVCKATIEVGTAPDFRFADGAEGTTGTTPLDFAGHVGIPITEGLMTMRNALVGAGLRDRSRIGACGKIVTGTGLVKRLIQGAYYDYAAHAMTSRSAASRPSTATRTPARRRHHPGPAAGPRAGRRRQGRVGAPPPGRPPPAAHFRSWQP
jgi:hypothetical protein